MRRRARRWARLRTTRPIPSRRLRNRLRRIRTALSEWRKVRRSCGSGPQSGFEVRRFSRLTRRRRSRSVPRGLRRREAAARASSPAAQALPSLMRRTSKRRPWRKVRPGPELPNAKIFPSPKGGSPTAPVRRRRLLWKFISRPPTSFRGVRRGLWDRSWNP